MALPRKGHVVRRGRVVARQKKNDSAMYICNVCAMYICSLRESKGETKATCSVLDAYMSMGKMGDTNETV